MLHHPHSHHPRGRERPQENADEAGPSDSFACRCQIKEDQLRLMRSTKGPLLLRLSCCIVRQAQGSHPCWLHRFRGQGARARAAANPANGTVGMNVGASPSCILCVSCCQSRSYNQDPCAVAERHRDNICNGVHVHVACVGYESHESHVVNPGRLRREIRRKAVLASSSPLGASLAAAIMAGPECRPRSDFRARFAHRFWFWRRARRFRMASRPSASRCRGGLGWTV